MKLVIIAVALFGLASCGRLDSQYLPPNQSGRGYSSAASSSFATAHVGPQIPILRLDNNNNGDGTYQYAYETGNSISAQEQGTGGHQANGGFSYTSPEGQKIQITYTADENGFHPQGAHLPTPPPIPEAILKSLELIKAAGSNQYNIPSTSYGTPLQSSRNYIPPSQNNGGYNY